MRIGIDCTVLSRPQTGFEAYTLGLVHALAQLDTGAELVLFVPRPVPEQLSGLRPRCSLVASPLGGGVLAHQAWLAAVLRARTVDVMHYPAFPPLAPPARFIMTVHDATPWAFGRTMMGRASLYFRSTIGVWAKRSRLIITPSEASKTEVVRRLGVPADRVRAIGLGVRDTLRMRPEPGGERPRRPPGLAPGYVLFVGTVEPRKNLGVVIRALARLRAAGTSRRLVIVGRLGWGMAELHTRLDEEGMRDSVVLAGHVPDEALASFYAHAAVLVQPSLHEGFGLPIVEAMAAGCPVIASDIPAHREVLGDAGAYFSPLDSEGLAAAVARLLADDRLRASMVHHGRQRAEEFTWDKTARQTLQAYHDALGGQAPAGAGDLG